MHSHLPDIVLMSPLQVTLNDAIVEDVSWDLKRANAIRITSAIGFKIVLVCESPQEHKQVNLGTEVAAAAIVGKEMPQSYPCIARPIDQHPVRTNRQLDRYRPAKRPRPRQHDSRQSVSVPFSLPSLPYGYSRCAVVRRALLQYQDHAAR